MTDKDFMNISLNEYKNLQFMKYVLKYNYQSKTSRTIVLFLAS